MAPDNCLMTTDMRILCFSISVASELNKHLTVDEAPHTHTENYAGKKLG